MTPSQWIFHFAAALVSAAPNMTYSKAIAVGRSCRPVGEPEDVAREIASVLAQAGAPRAAVPKAVRARAGATRPLH